MNGVEQRQRGRAVDAVERQVADLTTILQELDERIVALAVIVKTLDERQVAFGHGTQAAIDELGAVVSESRVRVKHLLLRTAPLDGSTLWERVRWILRGA